MADGLPLLSSLRTREQMEWIHDRFKIDGLERLARAEREYADDHGYYLPDVAALAHAALMALRYEQERLVCSWCGEDFEQGDWASTDCCNCDPVPASSLPSLLKDARREAEETLEEWSKEAGHDNPSSFTNGQADFRFHGCFLRVSVDDGGWIRMNAGADMRPDEARELIAALQAAIGDAESRVRRSS